MSAGLERFSALIFHRGGSESYVMCGRTLIGWDPRACHLQKYETSRLAPAKETHHSRLSKFCNVNTYWSSPSINIHTHILLHNSRTSPIALDSRTHSEVNWTKLLTFSRAFSLRICTSVNYVFDSSTHHAVRGFSVWNWGGKSANTFSSHIHFKDGNRLLVKSGTRGSDSHSAICHFTLRNWFGNFVNVPSPPLSLPEASSPELTPRLREYLNTKNLLIFHLSHFIHYAPRK